MCGRCWRCTAPGCCKAAAHITGGGLPGNLPRVLPDGRGGGAGAATWPVPPVFGWLARTGGVAAEEMLRVFNCGIGMALVVADPDAAIAGAAPSRRDGVAASARIEAADGAGRPQIAAAGRAGCA